MRKEIIIPAFVLLAAVAIAGWVRHPAPVSASGASYATGSAYDPKPAIETSSSPYGSSASGTVNPSSSSAYGSATPSRDAYGAPVRSYDDTNRVISTSNSGSQPVSYRQGDSLAYTGQQPGCVGQAQAAPAGYADSSPNYSYESGYYPTHFETTSRHPIYVRQRRTIVEQQPVRYVDERERRHRSTGRSVAIVAGSAAGGAAIGGIAGGGKGAGIGALAGGGAGFIYDRLTHNR